MNMNAVKEMEIRDGLVDVIEALKKVEFVVSGPITLKVEVSQPIEKGQVESTIRELAKACNIPLQLATEETVVEQKKELPAKLRQLEKWIEEGKYTKSQLVDKYVKKFAGQRSTVITMLSYAKSEKYNKFERIAYEDEKGIFKFKE